MRKQCLNAASIPRLLRSTSEESRVGLLRTPTRVPLSLSLSLDLPLTLLLPPISLSFSLRLQRQINVSPLFSFSEWRMQNACNRMRLSLLLPSSPFSIRLRKATSVTDRMRILEQPILALRLRRQKGMITKVERREGEGRR